jgi:hypothetical protein
VHAFDVLGDPVRRCILELLIVRFEHEIVAKGMWSAVCDHLTEPSRNTTLWANETEYRFNGLLMSAGLTLDARNLPQTVATAPQPRDIGHRRYSTSDPIPLSTASKRSCCRSPFRAGRAF